MDLNELERVIRLFEASSLGELEIEEGGRRVRLRRTMAGSVETQESASPINAAPSTPPPVADAPVPGSFMTITAPMVGVFYAAPAPGEPPFVQPGQTVARDQIVCILEAMKLRNEVAARFPLVIEEILAQDGQHVEFGQPLFIVCPIV